MQHHYRNLAITFFITTLWCVYLFFDYYDDNSFLSGLTLLFDYSFSLIFVFLLSVMMLVLRFTKRKAALLRSFFYTFAAYANIFMFSVYVLYLVFSHNVKEFFISFEWIELLSVIALLLGTLFLIDIYRNYIFKHV